MNYSWQVRRLPYHINDPEFADALVRAFLEIFPSHLMPGSIISKSDSEIPKIISDTKPIKIPPISPDARPGSFTFSLHFPV